MKRKNPAIPVWILMGSANDWSDLEPAATVLDEFGVPFEAVVTSAHRTPERTVRTVRRAEKAGARVFLCAAGYAAHLGGVVAAHTTRPVIGIPLPTSALQGLDSLLSTAMMPGGVPVATVTLGKAGARNAAILAVQILALSDSSLARRLEAFRQKMRDDVEGGDRKLREARAKKRRI